jgi:hypothetical protein
LPDTKGDFPSVNSELNRFFVKRGTHSILESFPQLTQRCPSNVAQNPGPAGNQANRK